MLSAQKMILSSKSNLLRDYFAAIGCPYVTADIICPDWSVQTVAKLLELVYNGVTHLETSVNINVH